MYGFAYDAVLHTCHLRVGNAIHYFVVSAPFPTSLLKFDTWISRRKSNARLISLFFPAVDHCSNFQIAILKNVFLYKQNGTGVKYLTRGKSSEFALAHINCRYLISGNIGTVGVRILWDLRSISVPNANNSAILLPAVVLKFNKIRFLLEKNVSRK